MTPCEKIGLKVGDEVMLTKEGSKSSGVNTKERIVLDRDDGSNDPYFRLENSGFIVCLSTDGFGTETAWFEMTKTEAEKRGAKFGTMGVVKETGEKFVYLGDGLVAKDSWAICVEGSSTIWSIPYNEVRLDHEPEFKEIKFCDATHEQRMVASNFRDDMGCQAKEVFYSEFQQLYHYVINKSITTTASPNATFFHVKVPA